MSQRPFYFVLGCTAVLLSLGAISSACSAGSRERTFNNGEGGSGAGSGSSSTSNGSSGCVFGCGNGGGGGSSVGNACSADLQSVTDENGTVLMTCPSDQGCFQGQCVPACEAAAKTQGSIGCDYFAPDPPFYANGSGPSNYWGTCYAVFLANTWSRPVKITVERDGQTFDATQFGRIPKGTGASTTYDPIPATGLPPNEVAVLFLSHQPGAKHDLGSPLTCPVTPAVTFDAAIQGSGSGGKAFRVSTDTPVTAYDILPYGGAKSYLPSASLLLPFTSWGTNYYTVAPHPQGGGQLWTMLVGTVDGTKLSVLPSTNLPGGGALPTANAGQTNNFVINKGEMIQWIGADPTGTIFQSDQPVGVWAGSTYLGVGTQTSPGGGGQESAHQQILPISALGSEYVGANVVTRLASLGSESIPYRLLGVVDGTQLTWDPAPPAGAPATLNAGQVAEFETQALFTVRSQDGDHPFAMTHYMPGRPPNGRPGCGPEYGGGNCDLGDEEWVFSLPPAQFLQRYVFFTDPTYATTNLVITRVAGAKGFEPVNIACLGEVTGWQAVGSSGQYEVAHVDLIRGFNAVTPACNTSRHEATSNGKFGITVWGTDWYASYGYPAGGNVGTINNVVVPPVPN